MKRQQTNKTSTNLEDMLTQGKVQQPSKKEISRQRQANIEAIHRQEKEKRREIQRELEEQHRKKKEEKKQAQKNRQQLNQEDKLPKQKKTTPVINNPATAPAESSAKTVAVTKNKPSRPSLQNKKTDVMEKQSCTDKELQAELIVTTKRPSLELKNLPKKTNQSAQVAREAIVEDLMTIRDSAGHNKHLERETTAIRDLKSEKPCKKHDATIRGLREEIEKMRVQHENSVKSNWTDIEFKTVIEGVCAESVIQVRDMVQRIKDGHETMFGDFQMQHEAKFRELHMYYENMFATFQINHGIMVGAMQTKHDAFVRNLRNANYEQGKRHEAAIRSMRELKNNMREEHQKEVDGMRVKYDDMIKRQEIVMKGLVDQKEFLCAEHEKMVQDRRKINQVLTAEIETIMKSLRAENLTAIQVSRNEYNSPVPGLSSPVHTVQNATEDECLQRYLAGEQQHTTIAAEQKPSQLHGGASSSKDLNLSSNAVDTQQRLDDSEVEALFIACSETSDSDN